MKNNNPNEFDRAFVGKPGCMLTIIIIIILISLLTDWL